MERENNHRIGWELEEKGKPTYLSFKTKDEAEAMNGHRLNDKTGNMSNES